MFSGALISLYCIGFLITAAAVILYNATAVDTSDNPVSFWKGLLYTSFWFITWVVVGWKIYEVNRDGS